jgi:hypothetical protein
MAAKLNGLSETVSALAAVAPMAAVKANVAVFSLFMSKIPSIDGKK